MTIRQQVGLAAALLALGIARVLPAQEAVLRTRERAAMLTEFRALLEHTDAATRMAAFEEAMSGKDQALKTMAMDAALGSTDDNLKTAALRIFLDGRASLPITVMLPERATEGVQKAHQWFNGLQLYDITVKNNVIGGRSNAEVYFRGGQMIPGGVALNFSEGNGHQRCVLTAKAISSKQLAGNLDCAYSDSWTKELGARRTVFAVRIDLP